MTDDKGHDFFDHLGELRKRIAWSALVLLIGTVVSYLFITPIYEFLIAPLADAMGEQGTNRLIYTHLAEGFITSIKLAFFTSLYIGMPFILFQIWSFIAPGLYRNEEKAVMPIIIATPVLFYLGGALVYFFVMPTAWQFFLSFQTMGSETTLPIQTEARISEYLSLVITFVFAFGICFELPVILAILTKTGFLSVETLKKGRKFAIVIAFLLGAFLTPPDIISQITLAAVLIILYELSLLLLRKS